METCRREIKISRLKESDEKRKRRDSRFGSAQCGTDVIHSEEREDGLGKRLKVLTTVL